MSYLTAEALSSFTLVPATEAQILVSRKRQSKLWGRGMTEEEFISRETMLEVQEHSVNGKNRAWALVPRDEPETLDYPCSCETFQRKIIVRSASSDSVQEAVGYGIASVFCGPEYRKKGYTTHMMRLLHYILAAPGSLAAAFPEEWGTPPPVYEGVGNARCSVLYSDVGDFYKYCGPTPLTPGWQVRSPVSTVWDPNVVTGPAQQISSEEFEYLSEEQCKVLWNNDATYIAASLASLPPSPPHTTCFSFLPNEGVAAYLLKRVLAEAPLLPQVPMEHWGVRLIQTTTPVYATWTLDMERLKPPMLVVTRLRATPESLPSLLSALSKEALRIGAKGIEVWNLEAGLAEVAAGIGGRTFTRTEHLPALAWYGPESPEEVAWVFAEKCDPPINS